MFSLHRTLSLGYLAQRRGRVVLIVVSIALGVMMLVATRCLDDSLHQAAKGAINPFATLADLLVSNGQTGVPAELADRLKNKNLPGLGSVEPLVMGRAALVELDDQSVRLMGVNLPKSIVQDPKAAPENNPWGLKIALRNDPIWDRLQWINNGEKPALVGAGLAKQLESLPNGSLHFQLRRGPGDVQTMFSCGTVQLDGPGHILEDETVFALDVSVAASIIYPQRSDYCTQLNLKLAPGADREKVRKAVEQFLKDEKEPGRVQTVEANEDMVNGATGSLELGFSVGGYLALLVGMFLVYNALSVSVVERRHDIGILRSIGATRVQIAGLFVGEAALLGLGGSLLGLPLGYGLAWAALKPMQQVLSEVFVKLPEATVTVSVPVMLLAVSAGLATAVLASLVPALQAADEQPADAVRRAPQTTRSFYTALQAGTAVVLVLIGVAAAVFQSYLPARMGSFIPPISFMGAVLVAMPLLVGAVGRVVQPFFRLFFGLEGRLAADNLVRSPNRTGLVVAALAATGGLLLQTAGFTYSTEVALSDWLDGNVAADLYVTAGSGISKAGFSLPMDARVGDELTPGPGRVPPVEGVEAVLPVRFHYFTYHDIPKNEDEFVYIIAVDSKSLQGEARDRALGGAIHLFDQDRRSRDPDRPVCVVSENFAALHHVGVGGHVTVAGRTTPTIDLEVIGTVVDYSYNRGTILVDYAWYSEEFADYQVDVFDVYLKPGTDARQVQAELMKPGGWAKKQAAFVERRDELRDAVTGQLERIYHLAYAQEFVVGLVALLGVVSALFISVLQRRRELGLLRAVGASRGQILRSVLAEASLMGVVGAVLGTLIGLALEWYTVRIMVFNEAGIVFPMLIPWTSGLTVIGGSVLAATLVGLWPAWRATRLRIPEAIAYE